MLPRLPPPALRPTSFPSASPTQTCTRRRIISTHKDRNSRNDIDGTALPMREEKQEMHLQTPLQQTNVAAAAAAAQSFAVPTARVAADYG